MSVYPSDIYDSMTILPFISSSPSVPLTLSNPLVVLSPDGVVHFSVGSMAIEEVSLAFIRHAQILRSQIPFRFTISASNSVSSAECDIRVWYEDRNEPPIVANATFSLPLYSNEGTALGRVFAVDPDKDQSLQYLILGSISHSGSYSDDLPFAPFFVINSDTGTISLFDASLFSNVVSEVFLRVMVVDDGSPSLNNTFGFVVVFHVVPL